MTIRSDLNFAQDNYYDTSSYAENVIDKKTFLNDNRTFQKIFSYRSRGGTFPAFSAERFLVLAHPFFFRIDRFVVRGHMKLSVVVQQ